MDFEVIIIAIIWIAIVVFSVLSSKAKKKKEEEIKPLSVQQQRQSDLDSFFETLRPDYSRKEEIEIEEPQIVTIPTLLTEEGERVTPKKKPLPAAIEVQKPRKIFPNKDAVRKALIFGEILSPKFDNLQNR